jgi:hypothetical protein
LEQVRNGVEKQTLANVAQRGKVAPEKGSQGGAPSVTLTNQEKILAARLGLTAKEWAEQKAKDAKARLRGRY